VKLSKRVFGKELVPIRYWTIAQALLLAFTLMPLPTSGNQPAYEPIHRIATHNKVVALTFDDGPDPTYTPLILNVLHKNRVSATFFVLGSQVDKYPKVMHWLKKAGHEIGNHGYHHYDLNKLTEQEIYDEIKRTERSILQTTGVLSQYYRPPGGVMTPDVLNAVQSSGYDIIHWSVDPRDWSLERTASVIANSVKNNITSGDIVLFHDGGLNQRQTLAALQDLITDLRRKGYTFVTISQLLDAAK
jgi:peptidoglycan/xylan/chitin deacetylase (PgdA/CDA1 family)